MRPPRDKLRVRCAAAALLVAAAALWAPARADAVASITCPQALLSFQWDSRDPPGTPYPITMSLSQCTSGFRSSALSYGRGTITRTFGSGVLANINGLTGYHVDLTITVPDLALGPVSVTRSFDVEAAVLTSECPCTVVPASVLAYAVSGPAFDGLAPAGWWTEKATESGPYGSSLVEASLAL